VNSKVMKYYIFKDVLFAIVNKIEVLKVFKT
jgi:hypothetical protein